jgi:hypothetical protein
VSTFLNALSASVVALALVADATGFDRSFRVFALILLPMIFFLGLATYVRVTQINLEDVFMVAAMNRLRHAYIVHAPNWSHTSRRDGTMTPPGSGRPSFSIYRSRHGRPFTSSSTTPTVVATIDAAIAGAGSALLAYHLDATAGWLASIGIGAFAVVWVALMSLQYRHLSLLRNHEADLSGSPRQRRGPACSDPC